MSSPSRPRFRGSSLFFLPLALWFAALAAPASAFPEPDSEFFVDFTGKVRGKDRMEIGRTLRTASESSRVQAMLVVIERMADYPDMPQDFEKFAVQVVKSWKIGEVQTKKGMLAIFSIQDRKFGAIATNELRQASTGIEDKVKSSMQGRVLQYLKQGDVSGAMKVAATNVAETLPAAAGGTSTGGSSRINIPGLDTSAPRSNPDRAPSPAPAPRPRHSGGSGFGLVGFIILVFAGFVLLRMFRGSRHGYGSAYGSNYGYTGGGSGYGGGGYGSGGGGGWTGGRGGGFLGGLFTGGVLGWMFGGRSGWGDHSGSSYGGSWDSGSSSSSSDSWSSASSSSDSSWGSSDSGGGSFDSFGGGNTDGGGSFGEW